MRTKSQPYLPGFGKAPGLKHGGDLAHGKRKTFRPIDPKQALHVVLRSSKARGAFSLLHPNHCNRIDTFLQKTAKKWGIRIFRFANVGNHLHLLIQVPSRAAWQRFSKEFSGGTAQIVTGARKGVALDRSSECNIPESAKRAFWDHLLFTRIVAFGHDFNYVAAYVVKNLFEAAGVPMKRLAAQGLRIVFVSLTGKILATPS